MEKNKIIQLRNVKKYYLIGEDVVIKAIDGISMDIEEGEFIAVMGPSGSGKSTSMNLIGSLDVPTSGSIFLDNEDISSLSESELAELRGRKIGFIFQQFNLVQNLTAKENVMLPMVFQGVTKEEREEIAESLLEMVDLGDRFDFYPNQLSGGEQQRVAIARALANNPEVILADEPTGNLDSKRGQKVMEFLDKLHKKGKTIVLVTHDASLAKKHAEKIYMLKDGKIEKIINNKRQV